MGFVGCWGLHLRLYVYRYYKDLFGWCLFGGVLGGWVCLVWLVGFVLLVWLFVVFDFAFWLVCWFFV